MREPHSEAVANHAHLESCAGDGDIAGEALTEALAGRLWSREIPRFGCRPCGQKGKAISIVALSQAACEPGAVGDHGTSGNSPHENREISAAPAAKWQAGGERRKPHAPRVRRREVGAGGSTDERFEQGRGTAGGEPGGKQPRRGERPTAAHGPRSEAGSRVPGAGGRTASSTKKDNGEVYFAVASSHAGASAQQLLCLKEASGGGS